MTQNTHAYCKKMHGCSWRKHANQQQAVISCNTKLLWNTDVCSGFYYDPDEGCKLESN